MNWKLKRFEDLSIDELYKILQARMSVFVIEQKCFYSELDGKDQVAYHLFKEEGEEVVAYLRIFSSGLVYPQASFGRVFVQKEYRNQGIAQELIKRALYFMQTQLHEKAIKIQAQAYLQTFYASFGFKAVSEVYLDDDIPHVDMILEGKYKKFMTR